MRSRRTPSHYDEDDRVECRTPSTGKNGTTRIPRWKYDLVRKALLAVVPRDPEGIEFRQLPELVRKKISPADHRRLGSLSWYTTTVKLHLEVLGELERLAGCSPQRLRRRR